MSGVIGSLVCTPTLYFIHCGKRSCETLLRKKDGSSRASSGRESQAFARAPHASHTTGAPRQGQRHKPNRAMQVRHLNLSVGRSTANVPSNSTMASSAPSDQKLRVGHLELTLQTSSAKQHSPSGSPPPSLPPSPPLVAQPEAFGHVERNGHVERGLAGAVAVSAVPARLRAPDSGAAETKQRRWPLLHRLFGVLASS